MVKLDPRIRSAHAVALALALGACTQAPPGDDSDASGDPDIAARRHHPPPDARPPDAPPTQGGSGGDPALAGVISCFTEGDPGATCALPAHCCFSNYSAQHDGECSSASCAWGTISCDGPEDCATGQHCCAHVLIDPDWGILGYKLACQAAACGTAPADQELCHPTASSSAGTCSTGTACVSALGADSDLPASLSICR